jgi:hypothetical protein
MSSENLKFCTFVPDDDLLTMSRTNKLGAIFAKGKLWDIGSTITYSFLNKPSDVVPKSKQKQFLQNIEMLEKDANKKYNEKGIYLKYPLDPLEYKFRKQIEDEGIDIIPKQIIEIIQTRFEPILNLTFKHIKRDDKNPADIRIEFGWNKGSRSSYGKDAKKVTDPKEQTITYSWFDVSTIMHELGHALGLLHEHQNPIGNNINWDEEKVYKWAKENYGWDKTKVDSQLLLKYGTSLYDVENSSVFDPDSIMLYTYPAELTKDNKGSIGGPRLSPIDVEYLIKVYTPTDKQYKDGIKLRKKDFLERIYFDMYKPTKENFEINIPKTNFYKILFCVLIVLILILFLTGIKYFMRNKKKIKR